MKKLTSLLIIIIVLAHFSLCFAGQETAEFVLLNGKVFTVSDQNPWVQAVAVKSGKIITLGPNEEIKKWIGPSTLVLDVQGKLVIPGFIDAHCHFASGGRSLSMLRLTNARSIREIQEMIAAKISEVPEGTPVRGIGSFPNTSLFPGLGWPTKDILDEVAPNNPVVIRRGGGHAVWINSMALKHSGISKDTEAPPGGEIVKDTLTGEPNGILKEAAQNLLRVPGEYAPEQDIDSALEHAAERGITGIHTASSIREIEIFKRRHEEGLLTLRVYAWLPIHNIDRYIEKGFKRGQGDDMVRVGHLKVFIDGTIGVRSALMFEDFTEEPGNSGLAQLGEEEFYALVEKAHINGFQIGVHAIGDKGVNWVLNGVERAQQKHGKRGLRHRVEHNTVNILSDTKRFKELGVVASMQPNITGSEIYRAIRLGKERARRVDMWRTLLDNGAILAWGTDWPVSNLNPMENLYRLVNRFQEQRLTMEEAIKYYTYGPAYASFEEDIKGTLEVGKLADMVVLSRDLFTIRTLHILKTEVLYTILGGKIVYQRR